MRTKFLLFFLPVILFSFFSCDVMKKRYSSGFYFSRSKTLPSVIEKDLVHLHNNTTVNHTSYGNQPKSSAKEKDEPAMVFANSFTSGNDFSLKKQKSIVVKRSEKISAVTQFLDREKNQIKVRKNSSNGIVQNSGGEAHGFVIATICLYFLGGILMLLFSLSEIVPFSLLAAGFLSAVLGYFIYKIGTAFSYTEFYDFTTLEKILLILSMILVSVGFFACFIYLFGG
jgi:hypothetical protein